MFYAIAPSLIVFIVLKSVLWYLCISEAVLPPGIVNGRLGDTFHPVLHQDRVYSL